MKNSLVGVPLPVVEAPEPSDLLLQFFKNYKILNLTVQNPPYRKGVPTKESLFKYIILFKLILAKKTYFSNSH